MQPAIACGPVVDWTAADRSADLDLVSVSKEYGGSARFSGAGPWRTRPEVSYWLPWQGQNQPPHSPRGSVGLLPSGMQPRWVQMPISTSHWSWPGFHPRRFRLRVDQLG